MKLATHTSYHTKQQTHKENHLSPSFTAHVKLNRAFFLFNTPYLSAMVQAAKTQMHAMGCQLELVKWIKTNETPISLKKRREKKKKKQLLA